MRTNAFVSGGYLTQVAPHMVGKKLTGYFHVCDYYATFCALANCSVHDERAARAGLPPVDSLNMLPYLLGKTESSPRVVVHLDAGAVVRGDLKYLKGENISKACWGGPQYPNASNPACYRVEKCSPACMYNITQDPEENADLAANPAFAADLASMAKLMDEVDSTIFAPKRGNADPKACDHAVEQNGNFWGPWLK